MNRFSALMRWSNNGKHLALPPWLISGHEPPSHEAALACELEKAPGIPRSLQYPSTSLGRMLDQTADRYGASTALIYGDERWNYRELVRRMNRVAAGLAGLGMPAATACCSRCPTARSSWSASLRS